MKKTVIIALIFFIVFFVRTINYADNFVAKDESTPSEQAAFFLLESYSDFLDEYSDMKISEDYINIDISKPATYYGDVRILSDFEGYKGTVISTGDDASVQWSFNVDSDGLYSMQIEYYPLAGRGINIERTILINDKIPYKEAYSILLRRSWSDQTPVTVNEGGNDINSQQVQKPVWIKTFIYDSSGYYTAPLLFYLREGENTISFSSITEPVVIKSISFLKYEEPVKYEQLQQEYNAEGYRIISDHFEKIQAERPLFKSDPKIRPKTDRTSPITEPYHPTYLRLNIIGGQSWQYNGENITWEIVAPESGLYSIAFRYRQEQKTSSASMRKLYINGEVPFEEMSRIHFLNDNEWQIKRLENDEGEPYMFYLDKGKNTLTLEVTLGEISEILKDVENTIHSLNDIYRNIIVYTGTTPDPFTDYVLDRIIPETIDELGLQGQKLYNMIEKMQSYGAAIGGDTAFISSFADQLIQMSNNPHTINNSLANFKANIGSLGTWLNELTVSPLKLDYIIVASPDSVMPKAGANFLERVWHEIRAFLGSFKHNYSLIDQSDKAYDQNITIWLGSIGGLAGQIVQTGGRDQALLLKNLIESEFSDKFRIGVNIQLVDSGAMLPAVLAGRAPDLAISTPGGTQVQYALRNAVSDLSVFDGFDEVKLRFPEGAFVPVTYKDKVYGMPESIIWDMLFYRKDILFELGIDIPDTWDDMINLIPDLARNNMEIGIGAGLYYTFLYQQGLKIYDEETDRSLFDDKRATSLFRDFTNLFVNYRLPVAYNMFNRFRTGEMPLVIAPYSAYNTMVIFAPEINGLWDFTVIPGTRKDDGSIDRTTIASGSYTMMFEQSKNKENAWEFIKWWTGSKAQAEYGIELEGLLGPAGRYTTANTEALRSIPWTTHSLSMLLKQQEWIDGIPDVPGGYFTSRHFMNAFYAVYNRGSEPRETLMQYTRIINSEIEKKRKEFGIE